MYPLTCHGGFNAPARSGKFDIVGFSAAVDDETLDAYVAIIDDPAIDQDGKAGLLIDDINAPTEQQYILVNKKYYAGDAAEASVRTDATIEWFPPESIRTRFGTSLSFTNIKQGSFCLYVR